nr:MAG TPA: hypothetical protein [Crassvirales sp.]
MKLKMLVCLLFRNEICLTLFPKNNKTIQINQVSCQV